jgi:hypothetical protein
MALAPDRAILAACGDKHLYTNRTARHVAHNLVWAQWHSRPVPSTPT